MQSSILKRQKCVDNVTMCSLANIAVNWIEALRKWISKKQRGNMLQRSLTARVVRNLRIETFEKEPYFIAKRIMALIITRQLLGEVEKNKLSAYYVPNLPSFLTGR